MADVNRGNRPLSPHLGIYHPYITMIASITNRIAGVGLAVGAFLTVWWLLAAATGPEYFGTVNGLVTSILGDLVMLGSLFALWWHFFGGLRHLYWDTNRGFNIEMANKLSLYSMVAAVVMTAVSLMIIL